MLRNGTQNRDCHIVGTTNNLRQAPSQNGLDDEGFSGKYIFFSYSLPWGFWGYTGGFLSSLIFFFFAPSITSLFI